MAQIEVYNLSALRGLGFDVEFIFPGPSATTFDLPIAQVESNSEERFLVDAVDRDAAARKDVHSG